MKRILFGMVMTAILLANQVSASGPYTIHGQIMNLTNASNGIENWYWHTILGEPGVSVTLAYNTTNGTSIQMVTTSADKGAYSFTVSDYAANSNYTVKAAKGNYSSPTMLGQFIDGRNDQIVGPVAVSLQPIIIRILSPSGPIISKGKNVLLNISVEPNSNKPAGLQERLSYNPKYASVNGVTEGNLLNRGFTSYFGSNLSVNGSLLAFGATRGRNSSVNSNGNFSTYNLTAKANGTVNFTLSNIWLISEHPAYVRSVAYSLQGKFTMPCDINGDYFCNSIDTVLVNRSLGQIAPNIAYYGRPDIDEDGIVTSNDVNISKRSNGIRVNTS